jgi:NhaP-type Na+/H+ or K+/H+ antiporter
MVPVALSMIGVGLRPASTLFLGWFGPRGLAAIILALIYLKKVEQIDVNTTVILAVIATVLLSIVAHGVSANPGIKVYARQLTDLNPGDPEYTANGVD